MPSNRKINVALFATVTDFGGAEKVILELLRNIDTSIIKYHPIIFTRLTTTGNLFFNELNKSIKEYQTIITDNLKIKYFNPLKNFLDACKALNDKPFDLIHSHGYRADFIGAFAAKFACLPIITTCHGYIQTEKRLKLYKRINYITLKSFNRIIAVSKGIRDELANNGITGKKIQVIPNAIHLRHESDRSNVERCNKRKLLKIADNDFVLGYIGRLSEEKGIKYLIEAASFLDKIDIPTKTLIIGEGPDRKDLEQLVRQKALNSRIIFTGFQEDIENWLAALDLFVLPSLTEGMPMALLEAMACGLPVIASAVGGIPQLIESGENGILVSAGNPNEIVAAVTKIYFNESLRQKLAENAVRKIKEEYDVCQWTKKIEQVYLSVVNS